MPFNLTTFDTALQAKLNTASVSMSAQEYLLLTKALAAAIDISEGVSLLDLKGTANGVAGLDGTGNVPISQLLNAIPSQGGNGGKFLTTNGTSTSWGIVDAFPSQTSNSGKLLTTNGTSTSWTATPSLTTLTTSGDVTVGDDLYVGSGAAAFESSGLLTNAAAVINTTGTQNSFAQVAFRNTEPTSSTDIIAYMDNGNDSEGWVGIGIAGSTFDDTTYGITGPGDGYIFHNTKAGSGRNGNLVLATGDAGDENRIVIAAGGFADEDNVQMTITPPRTGVRPGNVHIEATTPSTSPSTGALTVVGGVGIQGDVNIQGDITFGGAGTTLTTSTLAVSDPQVIVGDGNTTDSLDLGLVGEYGVSGTTKYTGIVRDATDGVYKFFRDTTVAPSSGTINFSGSGLTYAPIKVGDLEASSATIGSVTNTEIGYLSGVTSSIQTQLTSKLDSTTASSTYLTQTTASTTYAPLASPTFTGTITTPLTTAGYVTTTSSGIIGSVATIPNSGLTNSNITINGSSVSLGGTVTITGESFHPFLLMGA